MKKINVAAAVCLVVPAAVGFCYKSGVLKMLFEQQYFIPVKIIFKILLPFSSFYSPLFFLKISQ
jgi:hypothetical protein